MKRKLAVIISLCMVLGGLAGCKNSGENTKKPVENNKQLQVVTTIFPEYDWVNSILGDNPANMEVSMLLDNGVDLHSYQPTTEDIAKIAGCDLFVYVGGESDEWVEKALLESTNPDMKAINLLEVLGSQVKEEEIVEGMEHNHEHEHDEHEDTDHGHEDEHHDDKEHEEEHHDDADHEEHNDEHHDDTDHEEHDHEHELDEHVWLSLRNASVLCEEIADNLCQIDEANADTYKANLSAYKNALENLDKEYEKAASDSETKTLIFGDRFPFRYLTDDYDLEYYAAFSGCSAETEASFETVTFLARKIDELSINSIIVIDGSDEKIAKAIMENTVEKEKKILKMDSMQSVTAEDVESGISYISIMEENLSALKEALK